MRFAKYDAFVSAFGYVLDERLFPTAQDSVQRGYGLEDPEACRIAHQGENA